MRELHKDHSATFHFVEGELDSLPGPGVEGFYEGPFFSYYKWPRSIHDDESSIQEAYNLLYETIEEDGPFDGILGFSHGGALAAGFLAYHATHNPHDSPLFRCAVFFNSVPPFQMKDDQTLVFEKEIEGKITLPTLHVVGKNDFVLVHSKRLYESCEGKSSAILMHDKGHEIPTKRKIVASIAAAIKDLCSRSMFL